MASDTINTSYSKGISVGLTSIGNVSSINLKLNTNYAIDGNGLILSQNINYQISIKDGTFIINQNGNQIYSSYTDMTIEPMGSDAVLSFSTGTGTSIHSYKGALKFHKVSNGLFQMINILDFEDYLKGVVPYEMSDSYPMEALKAQAVASRTYAIYHKRGGVYDVTDDTNSQVYRGYSSLYKNSDSAVDSTKGQIITYNGQPIEALYSASNGGYTEDSGNVWGTSLPYFQSKQDPYDNDKVCYHWNETFTDSQVESILKSKGYLSSTDKFSKIDLSSIARYASGRVSNINVDCENKKVVQFTKDGCRNFLSLPSGMYNITYNQTSGVYTLSGKGYGHGVGMSQTGAFYCAKDNKDYKYILSFYYYNTTIQNVYKGGVQIAKFQSRISGNDRYGTAIAVAKNTFKNGFHNVVIATANDFPDGLSASTFAKSINAPILLLNNNDNSGTNKQVFDYLSTNAYRDGNIYIIGGTGVISESLEGQLKCYKYKNVLRIGGSDRYDTSYKVAENINAPQHTPIVIATGKDFPDALSISPIAAKNGWPILLVSTSLTADEENYIKTISPDKIYIVGGTGVVSDSVISRLINGLKIEQEKIMRLGGVNRYETSKIINTAELPHSNLVMLATGKDFPDALVGSVYAANCSAPIVLLDGDTEGNAVFYLKNSYDGNNTINLYALGGTGVIKQSSLDILESITN